MNPPTPSHFTAGPARHQRFAGRHRWQASLAVKPAHSLTFKFALHHSPRSSSLLNIKNEVLPHCSPGSCFAGCLRGSRLCIQRLEADDTREQHPFQRLLTQNLRAYTPEDEERVVSVNLPGLGKISNALKPSKAKELQKLVKAGESADDSFMTLGLGKALKFGPGGDVGTKTVAKFFSSDKFKAWSKYSAHLKHNDLDAILATLTKAYGEKNTAVIILLGKDSFSSHTVAKRLETVQFDKWYTVDNRAPRTRPSYTHLKSLEVKLTIWLEDVVGWRSSGAITPTTLETELYPPNANDRLTL